MEFHLCKKMYDIKCYDNTLYCCDICMVSVILVRKNCLITISYLNNIVLKHYSASGIVKAQSDNLLRIDAFMITSYFPSNSDFTFAGVKVIKAAR